MAFNFLVKFRVEWGKVVTKKLRGKMNNCKNLEKAQTEVETY